MDGLDFTEIDLITKEALEILSEKVNKIPSEPYELYLYRSMEPFCNDGVFHYGEWRRSRKMLTKK